MSNTEGTDDEGFKLPIVQWNHGTLDPDSTKSMHCELLGGVNNESSIIGILASNQNNDTYLSKINNSPYCNNFLLVRNKNSGTTRIFPTKNFLMLPYKITPELYCNSNIKDEKTKVKNASLNLNKAMGSKRNKKRVSEIEKSNILIDNVEKKLKKAIEDNELSAPKEVSIISSSDGSYLPPCNRAASSVEGVYNVSDVVSNEVLDSLDDVADEIISLKATEILKDERLSEFFKKVYSQTSNVTPLKIKLLLFVDTLVQFLDASIKLLKRKDPVFCEYSSALNEKLLDEFCVKLIDGKLARPPSARDKTLCYILVVLFLINDFKIDISILSSYLNPFEYQKLPKLLRAVGARPEKSTATNYVLKLPLAELSLFSGRRKGGRSK